MDVSEGAAQPNTIWGTTLSERAAGQFVAQQHEFGANIERENVNYYLYSWIKSGNQEFSVIALHTCLLTTVFAVATRYHTPRLCRQLSCAQCVFARENLSICKLGRSYWNQLDWSHFVAQCKLPARSASAAGQISTTGGVQFHVNYVCRVDSAAGQTGRTGLYQSNSVGTARSCVGHLCGAVFRVEHK